MNVLVAPAAFLLLLSHRQSGLGKAGQIMMLSAALRSTSIELMDTFVHSIFISLAGSGLQYSH